MAYQSGHFILRIVGTLSVAIPYHAPVDDELTFQGKRPPYVPPSEHSDEYYEDSYDYYEDEMREDTPAKLNSKIS